jgi:hypothetical protein
MIHLSYLAWENRTFAPYLAAIYIGSVCAAASDDRLCGPLHAVLGGPAA